ncbi:hypothetical protein BDB00DRAFT_375991 [Zychaea mexicana]|uniref:uncharacterized protein n=1 Tax=Zychaea mexicana TaxID=64656 RepID=UPI0022FE70F6|nr:uncharacterized protein BDB00DRAFT_375991 [Zychaea mexicana]KAI9493330.1 hypothetical protein BDB00DRAFT_375991 [Zychaea mexicana]
MRTFHYTAMFYPPPPRVTLETRYIIRFLQLNIHSELSLGVSRIDLHGASHQQ